MVPSIFYAHEVLESIDETDLKSASDKTKLYINFNTKGHGPGHPKV